mgnify:FL=1
MTMMVCLCCALTATAQTYWTDLNTQEKAYFKGHFDGAGHTIHNLFHSDGEGWSDDWGTDDNDDLLKLDYLSFYKVLFGNLDDAMVENVKREALCKISFWTTSLIRKVFVFLHSEKVVGGCRAHSFWKVACRICVGVN